MLYLSDSQPEIFVPKKLKTPIIAKYEEAITIPILLSAQKGMKCCKIKPFEVKPHIKKVVAKIKKGGLLIDWKRLFKLNKIAFSLDFGGG